MDGAVGGAQKVLEVVGLGSGADFVAFSSGHQQAIVEALSGRWLDLEDALSWGSCDLLKFYGLRHGRRGLRVQLHVDGLGLLEEV